MAGRYEEKKRGKRWVLPAALVLAALIVAALLLLRGCRENKTASIERERLAETGILPTMTAEQIQDRLNAIVEEGMFNVGINGQISFPSGTAEGNVCIENIEANHYPCTVRIVLTDTGEEILSTGLIDPGQYIYKMPLNKPLQDGIYDATATFTAYNAETYEEIGHVNVNLIISVGVQSADTAE